MTHTMTPPRSSVAGRVSSLPQANPDDPPVQRPPQGRRGPRPGPNYLGIPGRAAIVQGQVFLVALIVMVQLWLITDALYELLSGRASLLIWLTLASLLGFVLALLVTLWPHRRIEESKLHAQE